MNSNALQWIHINYKEFRRLHNNYNELTIIEVSSYTGDPLTILEHKIVGNAFYLKTVFEKLNFESTSTFTKYFEDL